MANTARKKKKRARPQRSPSPDSSAENPPKRSRTESISQSRSSRAKSVFRDEAYLPYDAEKTEYAFRIETVSADGIPDSLLKKAVQGLVRTCFPDHMFEELGVRVIEQHMTELNASEDAITRMKDAFRTETVHRVARMLAEYLDTAEKAATGVASLVAATNRLHFHKTDSEAVADAISALCQLREDMSATDAIDGSNNQSETHMTEKASETLKSVEPTVGPDQVIVDESVATIITPPSPKKTKHKKDLNKITSSWRWNIDADELDEEDVAAHFTRPTDLFAYHALPIVQTQLGNEAPKSAIRKEMDAIWTDMPAGGHAEWNDAYEKLRNGDMEILTRVPVSQRAKSICPTPGPQNSVRSMQNRDQDMEVDTLVKQENVPDTSHHEVDLPQEDTNHVTDAALALNHLSKESQLVDAGCDTPIIDLFWGRRVYTEADIPTFAKIVMDGLNSRVTSEVCQVLYSNMLDLC